MDSLKDIIKKIKKQLLMWLRKRKGVLIKDDNNSFYPI